MPPEGKAPLSTKPSQIRKRLQRTTKQGKYGRDLALYIEHVAKPLEEWDLEELARGRIRNKAGGFTHGPRMKILDASIRDEIARRLKDASLIKLRGAIPMAIEAVVRLLESEDERIVFQAAKFIIEYTVGLPQQNVTVDGAMTLQHVLAKALVLPGGQDAHPVDKSSFVEGEVLNDEEVDDDDEDL